MTLMEMEKSHYLVSYKSSYFGLVKTQSSRPELGDIDGFAGSRVVLEITQGGFGLDVVDEERQVKERFLEHLFLAAGIDLPRTVEAFDEHFDLEPVDEFINLDEDA